MRDVKSNMKAMRDMKSNMKAMKKWPKGLKEVYVVCDRCVQHLINSGVNPTEAQGSVLEILKEHEVELINGRYISVKNNLINIFLND